MGQITYANKVALNENPEIAAINKVSDDDMNEIKQVVNANYNNTIQITNIQPTDSDNKIWIDTGEIGSAVSEITNEYSTSIGLGYSANYVNNLVNGEIVYEAPSMTAQSSLTFEDISNYDYLEIIYCQTSGANINTLKAIPSISIGSDVSFTIITTAQTAGLVYINTARYSMTDTSMSFIRVTQKELRADNTMNTTTSTTPTNIMVYKIIGYKNQL